MTIEYLPVGIACNLKCTYCYQDPMRDAGNINVPRNWVRVQEVLTKLNHEFTVFGGEPLLAPIDHLEEVWKFGYEKFGHNGIQTNGILITDSHIKLFKRYKVTVGISIDGPGSLNSFRCPNPDDTELAIRAIKKLCDAKIIPSLIVTVHRMNSNEQLTTWLDELYTWGIKYVNFHMLEVERGKNAYLQLLSVTETTKAFLDLYEWSKTTKMNTEPFDDIKRLLTERHPRVNCTWNHCDPATTNAVQGVSPDGVMSNCGRTNKDGVNWVKADKPGFERYLLLHRTPQEYGGCRGCRYFIFCKGQCPGTAIDGDWRNRTSHCGTWFALFSRIERDLPNVLSMEVRKEIEDGYLRTWNSQHGDSAHGDTPHGDSHGDHTDHQRGIPAIILTEKPSWID